MGAHPVAHATPADPQALGASLGPALIDHCRGRLSHLEWFRSTWQHGGAATGFGRWRRDDGSEIEVMIKIPVSPGEYRWTTQLSAAASGAPLNGYAGLGDLALPTPRVMASSDSVAGYDLAWLIVERLDGHTLTHEW